MAASLVGSIHCPFKVTCLNLGAKLSVLGNGKNSQEFRSSRWLAPVRVLHTQKRSQNRQQLQYSKSIRAGVGKEEPADDKDGESSSKDVPFGYTRKDVILIGVGLLAAGYGLKYSLEAFGFDSARAGNAVQLIMVLGLTVGWISSYVFRVSNKDMTYAKQLKDYENKVMQKRLEELPEAELEAMLAQIEEEKRVLRESRKNMN
ncbi:hypothetical protein R1sor_014069 [Riccia sorocarpa]|uniref:Uncharacterized protein n=1 Tax=Riccia sorocarpa TaxID=122646 RepID=A0ABD3HBI9_9MARC